MTQSKKKIGIMGGTFDPIHMGHLIIAENAAAQFGLDKVLFLPNGNPPHKQGNTITDAKHRCNMISLAIEGNPNFELSTYEVDADRICYTYSTLTEWKEIHPDWELYFIMGGDSLHDFNEWRNPEIICDKATILAAVRDDVDETALLEEIETLRNKYHAKIFALSTPNFAVASNKIRKCVKDNKTIRYLLPEAVRKYIIEEKLYLD